MITLRNDYEAWASEPKRKRSKEVDFGVFWTAAGQRWPRWRVSWIVNTGELYAKELGGKERYAVLGIWPTREGIEALMRGWAHDLPCDLAWITRRHNG